MSVEQDENFGGDDGDVVIVENDVSEVIDLTGSSPTARTTPDSSRLTHGSGTSTAGAAGRTSHKPCRHTSPGVQVIVFLESMAEYHLNGAAHDGGSTCYSICRYCDIMSKEGSRRDRTIHLDCGFTVFPGHVGTWGWWAAAISHYRWKINEKTAKHVVGRPPCPTPHHGKVFPACSMAIIMAQRCTCENRDSAGRSI